MEGEAGVGKAGLDDGGWLGGMHEAATGWRDICIKREVECERLANWALLLHAWKEGAGAQAP